MRLTAYTDYALRTLMFLAEHRGRLVTIGEIAEVHGIAKNHLTKVVHQLGLLGYIDTVRGRNGGMQLRLEPADINIGAVVRSTESDFFMASCFDAAAPACMYAAGCGLKGTLGAATRAFLEVLDQSTLDGALRSERARKAAGSKVKSVQLHFKPGKTASKS